MPPSAFPASARSARPGLVLVGLAALLAVRCQAAPSAPADAASDYLYQGEYAGTTASAKTGLGVQVVALGGGNFTAAFLAGGLPGAGWDGSGRAEQSGKQGASGVAFTGQAGGYAAAVSADGASLTGTTPAGEAFTLDKVERRSPTLGAPPPPDALVLFDGTGLSAFAPGTAVLDSGLLLPQGSAGSGAVTLRSFGSFTLHLEFLIPFMPTSTGQARGNSGVYLQGRYELQILDSFGLNLLRGRPGEETQECGAFYQSAGPLLNMSFPPLLWQTYDVDFKAARFDSSGKTQLDSARVTVRLNGVVIHQDRKLPNNTLLGDPIGPADGPLRFQAHGDPVKYRNIWIVEQAGAAVRPAPPRRRSGTFRPQSPEAEGVAADGRAIRGPASSGIFFREGAAGPYVAVPR